MIIIAYQIYTVLIVAAGICQINRYEYKENMMHLQFIDEYERTRQITFSDTSSVVSFSGYCNKFRYCKMTNGNYREEQKELIPTNNSTGGFVLEHLYLHELDLFVDGDNFSKSSFIDLRFLTELPVQTEYIRKRKFALNYILLEIHFVVIGWFAAGKHVMI
uniref:Uncharacterized protein n=1 Tax=Wuchereria bancrofti TaxID=6293 RepID=A0A1I8ETN3_WUCBA